MQVFQTVQDCLSFFDARGLEELPLPHGEDEDSYRLPRVQQMDPIVRDGQERSNLISCECVIIPGHGSWQTLIK